MEMIQTTEWLQPSTKEEETRLRDAGFRWGKKGTHTSRTIMLDELRVLLSYCRPDTTTEDYALAVINDNCLSKRTVATRKLSFHRLSELYGLDSQIPLLRIMRYFWYADRSGQTIFPLLLALARDPLLRATAFTILRMRPGYELARQPLIDALNHAVGNRLSESTLDKVARNAASSWTQSGHLKGRNRKVRQCVTPTSASTTYALLMGYLKGVRGPALFETCWAQVLDEPPDELMRLAMDARRLGFLDMNQSGGVVEVAFSRLLSPVDRR
jgi:hypothetical protein